jgi:hypothetical protein
MNQGGISGLAGNNFERVSQQSQREAIRPADEMVHIELGMILEVTENNTVIVELQDRNGQKMCGDTKKGKGIPVLQELDFIIHNFGPLQKGMPVKVTYTGNPASPRSVFCEVIGRVNATFGNYLKQEKSDTSGETGVAQIFSGGM